MPSSELADRWGKIQADPTMAQTAVPTNSAAVSRRTPVGVS